LTKNRKKLDRRLFGEVKTHLVFFPAVLRSENRLKNPLSANYIDRCKRFFYTDGQ